jgi:hypothetical protein
VAHVLRRARDLLSIAKGGEDELAAEWLPFNGTS